MSQKWLPGIGFNLISPGIKHRRQSYPRMDIYTEFGHLTPKQILQVFLIMIEHSGYESSPFMGLVESELLKSETIESGLVIDEKRTTQVAALQEDIR